MKINVNELRVGMLIEYKNDLWEVLKTQHVKPGKGGAFNQVEMKSINKSTKINERFRTGETIEKANVDEVELNYLYEDGEKFFFINQKNFEQIEINKNIIGDKGKFLKENLKIKIKFYDDRAIGLELPNQLNFKIKSTDAALKGQTVSSSYKPAVLENDIKIQVPPFIESGDEIVIDTRTIEYVKKI